jgi:hypothetical protein
MGTILPRSARRFAERERSLEVLTLRTSAHYAVKILHLVGSLIAIFSPVGCTGSPEHAGSAGSAELFNSADSDADTSH